MQRRNDAKLALVFLLVVGCVSKAQHRSLADSYDAWFQKTKDAYVVEGYSRATSIGDSRRHEAEAVALVISSAKEAAK